jgi:hypothetical protein
MIENTFEKIDEDMNRRHGEKIEKKSFKLI